VASPAPPRSQPYGRRSSQKSGRSARVRREACDQSVPVESLDAATREARPNWSRSPSSVISVRIALARRSSLRELPRRSPSHRSGPPRANRPNARRSGRHPSQPPRRRRCRSLLLESEPSAATVHDHEVARSEPLGRTSSGTRPRNVTGASSRFASSRSRFSSRPDPPIRPGGSDTGT